MRGKDGGLSFAAHNPKVGGSNPPPQPSTARRNPQENQILLCPVADSFLAVRRADSPSRRTLTNFRLQNS
jgi:hypothetical protein